MEEMVDTPAGSLFEGNQVELQWDKYADPHGRNEALRDGSPDFRNNLAMVIGSRDEWIDGEDKVIVKFRVLKQEIEVTFPPTHLVEVWKP